MNTSLSVQLLIAVLISVTPAIAQKTDFNNYSHPQYDIANSERLNSNEIINNVDEAAAFLSSTFNKGKDYTYILQSNISSPFENHYTFVEMYKGIEIYQALIKVNSTKKGKITSIFSSFQEVITSKENEIPSMADLNSHIPQKSTINNSKTVWVKNGNEYITAILINYNTANGLNYEVILDNQFDELYIVERTAHYSANDTTAKALVFAPDPITSAHTVYAGQFVDNQDATNDSLDKYRDTVDLQLTFDNGNYILENDFVKITDHSLPLIPPVTSTTPFFYYDRSESGFEDVNVFYHITQQQLYLQSLGFTNLVDYQIAADCHGFNGSDNSAFTPSTNPPSLTFGEGGVDDAEDTDVIIHEYTHAILESAAPNTNSGTERNAMDEGYGDYMAASYSRVYDVYQDSYVFNWDGHNPFWPGRLVTSSATYPDGLNYHLYKDAPMWSSAILRIERNTSREVAHIVSLQAAYSYSSNMTMAQGAQLIIEKDSLIYNGAHYAEICYVFKDKGMIDHCNVARPNSLVDVSLINNSEHPYMVFNSAEFANGQSPIQIKGKGTFDLVIYDLMGKVIGKYTSTDKTLTLTPDQLKSGLYLFQLTGKQGSETVKVLRY